MENDTFRYSYSSSLQEELKDIKKKYAGQPEDQQGDQLELLRKLDKSSTRKSTIVSIAMGAAGCLTMGIGMCCTMVWAAAMFLPGIIIGVIGIAMMAAAYPVYVRITKRERARIAPQVLDIIEKLSKEDQL